MLDLQARALLEQAAAQGAPDFADLPPAECRAFFREFVKTVDAPVPAGVTTSDRTIAGPEGNELTIRSYRPEGGDGALPVLFYIHGGGWVIGGLDEYDGVCGNLADQSGCLVVAVDYRLAPEYPFPAAPEDCYATLLWLADNAGEIGGDASRIAVAGDSAGGNMATVMTLLARDRNGPALRYQALIYPAVALRTEGYDSYRTNAEGYFLTTRSMGYFGQHYAPDLSDYRAAPVDADLSGLPPACVLVAGYDPLHDEGVDYARKLMAAGVPTVLSEYSGMIHGFISMSAAFDAGRQAVAQVAAAVRGAMAD